MSNRHIWGDSRQDEIKKYWYDIHVKWTIEILKWLYDGEKSYLGGMWYREFNTFYFSIEQDAILFKLTWL